MCRSAHTVTTTSVYDTFGNVLRTSREAPGIPRVARINEYDETGRFLTRTYTEPASAAIEYMRDIFGNVLLEEDVTDESSILATSHVYDSWDREAIRVQPDGRRSGTVWGWSGDDYGTYFKVDYALGTPWTKTWYDQCGREIRTETIGFGNVRTVTENTYDAKGQPVKVASRTGELKASKTMTYDSRGRLTSETRSNGRTTRYTYGKRRITAETDSTVIVRDFDALGNVRKVTDPATSVEYEYASNGKPRSVTCAGNRIRMEYDAAGNRVLLDDPATGRFLSADRYIQLPDNSQSFNRYSYCLNNPLKYTDPSGEAFVVDDLFTIAAIGAIMGGGSAVMSGGNVWKGALVGALSSTASYGIGSLFGHAAGTFGHELLRAGAHGLSNGIIGAIDGHGFGSSFAGGFVSSFAGSGLQTLGVSSPLALSGGAALSGGLATMSLGGSFWDGVSIGSTVGAYNHGWRTDTQGRYYELDEVVCLGKRGATVVAGELFDAANIVVDGYENFRENTVVGNNGRIYYRNPNGNIFQGNQYVKTHKLEALPTGTGLILDAWQESPEVMFAYHQYGPNSREFKRAIAVALGRISGDEIGTYLGGKLGGFIATGVASYFSMGALAAPAYVGGCVVGSIGGGYLGSEIGGYAAGLIFDLTY